MKRKVWCDLMKSTDLMQIGELSTELTFAHLLLQVAEITGIVLVDKKS